MALWETSTKEARTAGILISELRTSSSATTIEAYFDFADRWNAAFPKSDKNLYEYGEKAIKIGSKLAGAAPSTTYSILRTTGFYSRKDYKSLETRAKKNGVVLYWTHLRLIVDGLSDNLEARTKTEDALVERQMTEGQLKAFIRELVPSTKTKEEPTLLQQIGFFIESYRQFTSAGEGLPELISAILLEYAGDIESGQALLNQMSELTVCMEELHESVETHAACVQQAHETILSKMTGTDAEELEDGDIFHEVGVER